MLYSDITREKIKLKKEEDELNEQLLTVISIPELSVPKPPGIS